MSGGQKKGTRKKKPRGALPRLSKRSRQVLETLYRLGEASAAEIQAAVGDLPSYSATRAVLRRLHERGLVKREEREFRYVYAPVVPRQAASRTALVHLLETFFDGSPTQTMKALLDLSRERDPEIAWDELERWIREARKEGR